MIEVEYQEGARYESFGEFGVCGVKVLVSLHRPLSEMDERILRRKAEEVHNELMAESIRLDPRSQERARRQRDEVLSIFPEPIFAEEVPNGYCSQWCCRHLPWFRVTTKAGRFTVGWRKRVISIDWTETHGTLNSEELFPDEDVTKFKKSIHAWGVDKAREYVARIMEVRDDRTD